jgi:hypothetical protein
MDIDTIRKGFVETGLSERDFGKVRKFCKEFEGGGEGEGIENEKKEEKDCEEKNLIIPKTENEKKLLSALNESHIKLLKEKEEHILTLRTLCDEIQNKDKKKI